MTSPTKEKADRAKNVLAFHKALSDGMSVEDARRKAERVEKADRKQGYDIVAFHVPGHKSLLYKRFLTGLQLHDAIDEAMKKDANVISIRWAEKIE